MAAFAQLRLSGALEKTDWVNSPTIFSEQLTAHLWTTHQIDAFTRGRRGLRGEIERGGARRATAHASSGNRRHRAGSRRTTSTACSASFARRGKYFTQVQAAGGLGHAASRRWRSGRRRTRALWPLVHRRRATRRPRFPMASPAFPMPALVRVRAAVQNRMRKLYEAPVFDPEALPRTDGADAARRGRTQCRCGRGAQPLPAERADGRFGNAGFRHHFRPMGGAGGAAARAARHAAGAFRSAPARESDERVAGRNAAPDGARTRRVR